MRIEKEGGKGVDPSEEAFPYIVESVKLGKLWGDWSSDSTGINTSRKIRRFSLKHRSFRYVQSNFPFHLRGVILGVARKCEERGNINPLLLFRIWNTSLIVLQISDQNLEYVIFLLLHYLIICLLFRFNLSVSWGFSFLFLSSCVECGIRSI